MALLVQVHGRWALAPLRDLSDLVSSLNPKHSSANTHRTFLPDQAASFKTSACLTIPAPCYCIYVLYAISCMLCTLVVVCLFLPYSLRSDLFLLTGMQWTFHEHRTAEIPRVVWVWVGTSLLRGDGSSNLKGKAVRDESLRQARISNRTPHCGVGVSLRWTSS